MTKGIQRSGKAKSIPEGLAFAVFVSGTITLVLSATLATFLNNGRITWEKTGYWIMVMLLTASYIGGRCAYAVIKRQRVIVSLMAGMVYWVLLLCITALFFGGDFDAVMETAALIVAGSAISAFTFMPNKKKSGKRQYGHVVKLNKNRG